MTDQENNTQREGEIPQQSPEAGERKETYREKFSRWKTSLREGLGRFGSRKQSSQEAMQAVNPEAQFTDEERQQLDAIEATAQGEVQSATISLEKIDTAMPDGGIENLEGQSVEPAKEKTASIDDLLAIAQETGEGTPQEQVNQTEAEKVDQSREFIESMRKELEAIQAEKKKQELGRGKLQYYALTNQRDKLKEGMKSLGINLEYYLKPGEKIQTVEYGTQSWKQRAEQPIGNPEQFLQQVKAEMEEAQKKAEEAPPVEPYYEKFKQDKGEMFLQKGPYASGEEAKTAFDLFNEKIWAAGRNDKIMYQKWVARQKRTLEGFTQAALENNDLETAIEGLDMAGQLEKPETITQLREKMIAFKESADPKDKERLVKAGQKLQEVKSRRAAEAQTS